MTGGPKFLLERLARAREARREAPPARPPGGPQVIAVCNQKGGCGKTTTAINLAASLALKGNSTLLVDLDPQAHATLGLGVDVEQAGRTVYDIFRDPHRRLEEALVPTKVPNLSLVPANTLLSGSQLELASVLGREQVLRRAVQRLDLQFRHIILDCSPSLNLVTINALTAADFCLVPLQPHYYALEGMKELFATLELIQERFNPELRLLGIVPVLVDNRAQVVREMVQQIRDYFQEKVFETSIRFSAKLIESSIVGQPVAIHAPRSAVALDYLRLSEEVLARIQAVPAMAGALLEKNGTATRTAG